MASILQPERPGRAPGLSPERLARNAARGLFAGGLILLIGSLMDLGTLWFLQRQDNAQWEFVALGTTTNAYPLLLLSVLLLYGALAIGRSSSLIGYRVLASVVVLLGLLGLAICFLLVTNYYALTSSAQMTKETVLLFKSIMVKAGGVSLLYGAILLPVGVLGLRVPKAG
ncbi:MAG: hypothetical protein ACREMO_10940 [Gemmatimonadales bacterium]